jgi:hypothetical protein
MGTAQSENDSSVVTQKKRRNYMKRADDAFSAHIRSRGYCESDRERHAGVLQCAHIITRSYKSIRTDERNALCLCQGCHTYYTHSPLEWEAFIERVYPGLRDELRDKALRYERVDWKSESEYWQSR